MLYIYTMFHIHRNKSRQGSYSKKPEMSEKDLKKKKKIACKHISRIVFQQIGKKKKLLHKHSMVHGRSMIGGCIKTYDAHQKANPQPYPETSFLQTPCFLHVK